jgi:hypothetical protein
VRLFYAKSGFGDALERGDRLIVTGIAQHPQLNVVSSPDEADIIICFPWDHPEVCNEHLSFKNKIIAIDYADLPHRGDPYPVYAALAYFKRSVAHRRDSISTSVLPNPPYIPISYGVQSWYIHPGDELIPYTSRQIHVYCTLMQVVTRQKRKVIRIVAHGGTRARAKQWLGSLKSNPTYNIVIENTETNDYFRKLRTARIVVTANPSIWEGDSRLWESLSSGALVFSDRVFGIQPPELLDGKHLVYYDGHNETQFLSKVAYYLEHPVEASLIANRGRLFACNYHAALNRADYVFWTSLCIAQGKSRSMCSNYPIGTSSEAPYILPRPKGSSMYGGWKGGMHDLYFDQIIPIPTS